MRADATPDEDAPKRRTNAGDHLGSACAVPRLCAPWLHTTPFSHPAMTGLHEGHTARLATAPPATARTQQASTAASLICVGSTCLRYEVSRALAASCTLEHLAAAPDSTPRRSNGCDANPNATSTADTPPTPRAGAGEVLPLSRSAGMARCPTSIGRPKLVLDVVPGYRPPGSRNGIQASPRDSGGERCSWERCRRSGPSV